MPFTPLHYCAAYLVYRFCRHPYARLSFPALIVSSVIPDVEIPVIVGLTGSYSAHSRLLLHSILGAATLGVLISVLVTMYIYPKLVSSVLGVRVKHLDTNLSSGLVFSSLLGVLMHVFIDALQHQYNPLFYPFTASSVDTLILFNNSFYAGVLIQSVFAFTFLMIIVYEVRRRSEGLWERLLVG